MDLNKKKFLSGAIIYSNTIMTNNFVDIVHNACKICWDQKPETTLEGKLNYIEKRIKSGHESVIEHSNIVMLSIISKKYYKELVEILDVCDFIHTKVRHNQNNDICLLMGGSIRGYKHIFRNIENMNNPILHAIRDNLYQCCYKNFFVDFIEAGIMQENKFTQKFEDGKSNNIHTNSDTIVIENIDHIEPMYDKLKEVFTYDDLLDMCTVTVEFKSLSRTATHQLVRHRNAITQESQRYVDYSAASFISPSDYKEPYKDREYEITFNGKADTFTMDKLGKEIINIYCQLRSQNVLKEDARAFLPSNVKCNHLYMTFTYRTLIKFLELRTDKAAQEEIRQCAKIIEEEFVKYASKYIGDIYKYLTPKYILAETDYDYSKIDEVIE